MTNKKGIAEKLNRYEIIFFDRKTMIETVDGEVFVLNQLNSSFKSVIISLYRRNLLN